MRYIIKFMNKTDNRIMIITYADGSYMEFDNEGEAQKMAYAFEDQYPELHWVTTR